MPTTKLKHYVDVQNFIASILKANNEDGKGLPHRDFWSTMSYDQFVHGNVPGVTDPNSGQPMRILIPGNSNSSNLILSLRGAPGTVFDANTGAFGQMPANGPPMFTDDQIQSLADWIDQNCPE